MSTKEVPCPRCEGTDFKIVLGDYPVTLFIVCCAAEGCGLRVMEVPNNRECVWVLLREKYPEWQPERSSA